MCKWHYIIFLMFLVLPRQAQLEPHLASHALDEIDGFLSQLSLNHKALLELYSLCPKSLLKSKGPDAADTNALVDSPSLAKVQATFKELKEYLNSPNMVEECPNIAKNVQ